MCLNCLYVIVAILALSSLAPMASNLVSSLVQPVNPDTVPLDLDEDPLSSPLAFFGVQYDLEQVDPGRLDASGASGLLGSMDHVWSDVAGPLPYAEVISNSSSDPRLLVDAVTRSAGLYSSAAIFTGYSPCESLDLSLAVFPGSVAAPFFVEQVLGAFRRECALKAAEGEGEGVRGGTALFEPRGSSGFAGLREAKTFLHAWGSRDACGGGEECGRSVSSVDSPTLPSTPSTLSQTYNFGISFLNLPTLSSVANLMIPLVSMLVCLMCAIPVMAIPNYLLPSATARFSGQLWTLQVAGLSTLDYHLALYVALFLFYGLPECICQTLAVWASGAISRVLFLVWFIPGLLSVAYTISVAVALSQRFNTAFSHTQFYPLALFFLAYLPVMVVPFLGYVFPPALMSLMSVFPGCGFVHAVQAAMAISADVRYISDDGSKAASAGDLSAGFFGHFLLLDCVIQLALVALLGWAAVASDRFVPNRFPRNKGRRGVAREVQRVPPCDNAFSFPGVEPRLEEPERVREAVSPLGCASGPAAGFLRAPGAAHKAETGDCLGLNVERERRAVEQYCADPDRDPSALVFRDVSQVFSRSAADKRKSGPERINALRHVSLMASSAEGSNVTCLIGPNGSGKTTLFKCAMLSLNPTGGSVYLGAEDTSESSNLQALVRRIGICMQDDVGVFQVLTVQENLQLYQDIVFRAKRRMGSARYAGNAGSAEGRSGNAAESGRDAAVPAVSTAHTTPQVPGQSTTERLSNWSIVSKVVDEDFLGLREFLNVRAQNLSGGWRRRLSVACALSNDPEILLLDEATSGLDLEARNRLWAEIRAISRGRTLLVTTHSLDEADKYCDKLVFMYKGRIVCLGSSREVKCRSDGLGHLTLLRGGRGEDPASPGGSQALWEKRTGELEKRFPGLALQPSSTGARRYRFPVARHRIEDVFRAALELKEEGVVSDFSITQPTLDQIFLSLMRDAEEYFGAE